MNNWRQYQESNKDIDSFLETRSGRLVIMTLLLLSIIVFGNMREA